MLPMVSRGILRPMRDKAPTHSRNLPDGFFWMLPDHWNGQRRSDVVTRLPSRHPMGHYRNAARCSAFAGIVDSARTWAEIIAHHCYGGTMTTRNPRTCHGFLLLSFSCRSSARDVLVVLPRSSWNRSRKTKLRSYHSANVWAGIPWNSISDTPLSRRSSYSGLISAFPDVHLIVRLL